MRISIIVAALLAVRAAFACEPKGTPIFRIKTAPMERGGDGLAAGDNSQVIEVFADGAWTLRDNGAKTGAGCMPSEALALLKKAIAKAKFKRATGMAHCMALPTTSVTYEAPQRGKKASTASPCGDALDTFTERAAGCVFALTDDKQDLVSTCRGDQDKDGKD